MVTTLNATQLTTLAIKRHLEYLEIQSNASNPTYQVDINSGIAGADDGSRLMEVSSPITVDITASGANGLDTGSEAANTWYYIYLIFNPTTGTTAGLFSTSSSSPTMPSGYTKKRLVGAVRNDGSSDFYSFKQINNDYSYLLRKLVLSNGTSTSYASVDFSNYVPPIADFGSVNLIDIPQSNIGGRGNVLFSTDGTNLWTAMSSHYTASYIADSAMQFSAPIFTVSPIRFYYSVEFSGQSCYIGVNGFCLNL